MRSVADPKRPANTGSIARNGQRRTCKTIAADHCGIPADKNDIDMGLDQVRHKFGNQINALSVVAPIDREVLALDEARPPKFIERHEPIGRIAWTVGHAAEAISPARFLRPHSERPRSRHTADKRDEIAPLAGFPSMSRSAP